MSQHVAIHTQLFIPTQANLNHYVTEEAMERFTEAWEVPLDSRRPLELIFSFLPLNDVERIEWNETTSPAWEDDNGVPVYSKSLPVEISEVLKRAGKESEAIQALKRAMPALAKTAEGCQIGKYRNLVEYLKGEFGAGIPDQAPAPRYGVCDSELHKAFFAYYEMMKESSGEGFKAYTRHLATGYGLQQTSKI